LVRFWGFFKISPRPPPLFLWGGPPPPPPQPGLMAQTLKRQLSEIRQASKFTF